MALNCNTCKHKKDVADQGYCTEFLLMPQIHKCAMHSEEVEARKAKSGSPLPSPVIPTALNERGSYLWLQGGI